MEKPLSEYKNKFGNILTIGYWIAISILWFFILLQFFERTDYNSFWNFVSLLFFSLILIFLIWSIKRFKIFIHEDAIVFKEKGWHPLIENEYGVAFENINYYKINNVAFSLNWIVLKRINGKAIRKLISLSANEFSELSKILNEKIKKQDS